MLPVITVFTGDKGDKVQSWLNSVSIHTESAYCQISVDRYHLTGSSVAPGAVLSREHAQLWLETRMLLKGAGARISDVRSTLHQTEEA